MRRTFIDRYGLPAVALLAIHAAVAWFARAHGILTEHDDAIYVLLNRSLRAFHYRELFRADLAAHARFPPGYPAALALWSAVGGENVDWLITASIATSVGALALLFSAIRTLWGPLLALACLAALTLNPVLIEEAGSIASEAPFIFFTTLALWASTRREQRPFMTVLAGTAGIAAALTRSVGVTVILAIGLMWLWQGRWRALGVYALVAILTVGSWLAWTAIAPEQVPGGSYFADAVARPANTGIIDALIDRVVSKRAYAEELVWRLPVPGVGGTRIDNIFTLPIVFGAVLAGAFLFMRQWPLVVGFALVYGSLLLVWPWTVPRFLGPLVPLVVVMLVVGVSALFGRLRPAWSTAAAFGTAVMLAAWSVPPVYAKAAERRACDGGGPLPSRACMSDVNASFFDAIDYIRAHVPEAAIFISGKEATLYYYTGHRTASLPLALGRRPEDFMQFLRSHSVTHIALLQAMPRSSGAPFFGAPGLGEMLRKNCQHLHLEAKFPPISALFRVPADGEIPDSVAACEMLDAYSRAILQREDR